MLKMDRRAFCRHTGLGLSGAALGLGQMDCMPGKEMKAMKITKVNSNFEREPLARPFGFKGGQITGVWQTIAMLESENGHKKVGLGAQSVLWSDSAVSAAHSEQGGNALMYAMSERALQAANGQTFASPLEMLDALLPEVYAYGQKITNRSNLRKTFALNALVGIDNAAWLLHAAENNLTNFDDMIPAAYQPGLSARHDRVASIPALGYGTPIENIVQLADEGFFIMKIKIGAPGSQSEMVEKDKLFLKNIHEAIGHYETPHTSDGKLPYYFDANGRYDSHDDILRFLDYADKIGALDQIAVLEEPFGERNQDDVREIVARGVRVAADESAHTDADTRDRIEQGYNAIAVKAVAKTMSMTMRIAQVAFEHEVPCFCADLTVNPTLVEWNKVVAARLPAFPELPGMGLQETNGWQNYRDWDRMRSYLPNSDAAWTISKRGVYLTDNEFFEQSGGILAESEHYLKLF